MVDGEAGARRRAVEMMSLEYFYERFRRRIDRLSDEEYLWEPVPGCLTITGVPGKVPREGTVAFTNIAWRMGHIGDVLREERNWRWLGRGPERFDADIVHPTTVAGGIAFAEDA